MLKTQPDLAQPSVYHYERQSRQKPDIMQKITEDSIGVNDAATLYQTSSEKRQKHAQALAEAENTVVQLLDQTLDAVNSLARMRQRCKLSNTRVTGIYRELKELSKVMAACK